MLSPHDPRLRNYVPLHTATHGTIYVKTNSFNESGYDRVGKNGKKWRAWVSLDGKQVFLKPYQDTAEKAAIQLYIEEHPEPTLKSPSPGHRKMSKRAPPSARLEPLSLNLFSDHLAVDS